MKRIDSEEYLRRQMHIFDGKSRHDKFLHKKQQRDIPPDIYSALKRELIEAYGKCCAKCNSNKNLEIDHVLPVSMGGVTAFSNLQLLCRRCNKDKGYTLKDWRGKAIRRIRRREQREQSAKDDDVK